ncbi:MAG: hypothetical protein NTZ74_00575 [Chloroflexi bacterium]|nr:hypothetical protein [Chloroflexota bacterium]
MKTVFRKRHDLPIILVVILLLLAMLACGETGKSNTSSTSTPTHGSNLSNPDSNQTGSRTRLDCLAGITPGKTTRTEVIALLGEPLASEPDGDFETLLYASPFPRQYNSITIQNQVVVLLSEVLDEGNSLSLSAILAEYGKPAQKTYSHYLQGSKTYIYPDRGQAIIASAEVDAVFIQQCFVPMALEEYMNSWGKSLPAEDPFTK